MTMILALILIIILIVLAVTRWKLHPFLTLLLAALVTGLLGGLDVISCIDKLSEGFGNTLKSIGIVIACGTIIGTFLENSGGTQAMANSILKIVGQKKSPLAMNITGFIVSIPVFCDSGFVILSALNKALSKKTGLSLSVLAIALATGLYATHVFVPPTPGPLAAAATLEADIGLIIMLGLIVAIPSALVGLFWAQFYCHRFQITEDVSEIEEQESIPSAYFSFLPLIVPILLIAMKSIAEYPTHPFGSGSIYQIVRFVGHPIIALIVGVFLSFKLIARDAVSSRLKWVGKGLTNAGVIILITGAGGAFGNVLRATGIGNYLGEMMAQWNLGIILPFLIAAVLKSAQGSSTVAIITTAALMSPLLSPLGLDTQVAKALVVLAIGAGSMTVSHLNDSYFWVVSQFSHMDTATSLKSLTLATLWQGLTGLLVILILSWILI
jgi:GntP family gluconate:H+ symporter